MVAYALKYRVLNLAFKKRLLNLADILQTLLRFLRLFAVLLAIPLPCKMSARGWRIIFWAKML